jgi:hypothetical protein
MSCDAAFIVGDVIEVAVDPVLPVEPYPDLPLLDDLEPFGGLPDVPAAIPAEPALPAAEVVAPDNVSVALVDSTTPGVVAGVISQTGVLAQASQASALATIEALALYDNTFDPLDPPVIPVGGIVIAPLGDAPPDTDLTANFPTAPDAPITADIPLADIGIAPAYDVADVSLFDIPLPDPFDALLPAEAVYDALPVAIEPDFSLPPVPTLIELSVPDAPVLDLPLFDAEPGLAPSAPEAEFIYSQVEYNTALLTAMNTRLAGMVGDMTSTGIDQDVEDAIWNRAADREAMLTHRATAEALRLMKTRGFRIPDASLVRIVQQALQSGLQRDASLQRAVAIERANLQQSNFRFALETTVSLESRMIDKANAAQARALEAAKATVTAEIQLFNAKVQMYSADVQAFAMKAEVFKTRLVAALAQVDVYKAKLEAQRAIGEVNSQKVAIYRAQIEGVRAIVSTYSTRVDAAKSQIASNKSVVEGYRARIGALEAQVTAKITEYDTYSARVRGQAAKVQVFSKQVQAYRSRVQAFDTTAKANIAVQELRLKQTNEFPLELYSARMDAYRTAATAEAERLQSTASVFNARIRAFSAQEGAKVDHVGAQIKAMAANAAAQIAQAEIAIDSAKQNYASAEKASSSASSNLRSAGQLSGQMAAAAIAAQSVTAAISESGSMSSSNSESNSASNSTSYSASTSTGSSSSTSTAHSSTTGVSLSNSRSESEGRAYSKSLGNSTSNRRSASNATHTTASNGKSVALNTSVGLSSSVECTDQTTISE